MNQGKIALSTHRAATSATSSKRPHRQRGTVAVEVSVILAIFLMLVFGILEISRALYMFNTLQEVTRRAARDAAVTAFNDTSAMDNVRLKAIFPTATNALVFGHPITDRHILIDYMSLKTETDGSMSRIAIAPGAMPSCPARNKHICTADSGNDQCIRFVRVRICEPGSTPGSCTPVKYVSMTGLVQFPMELPLATSIVRAESLGYTPGMAICN